MAATLNTPARPVATRKVTVAVAAAGISSFALLYAPQPVLPQLAADFGLGPGGASLAVSVATGALAIAVLPIAALSEVVGRRRIILVSVIASVLLGLLLPLAPSFPVLLGLRAVQGVAIAGFPGVAAAYLAERLGAAGVAAAVGAMIAGNTVGGMLGRLCAGFAASELGWHGALLVVAGIALVCTVITLATLPGDPPGGAGHRPEPAGPRQVLAGLALAVRSPVLLAQYVVALLAMGSFVALYNVAGFRLTSAPLNLAPAIASLVFLAYAMGAVSSVVASRLVARVGRARSVLLALLVAIAGAALTASASLPVVVLGFVVFTAGFFAAHAVANGWAVARAPESARGQVSGLYTLAYYLGSSTGGTIGAAVYGGAGWGWLVVLTSVWLGLAALGILLVSRRGAARASR